MSSQNREVPTNYYKLVHPKGGFCIVSFRFLDPVVADNIIKLFIRYNIRYGRISQERVFEHTLKHFNLYRIGAISFYVGSRDFIRARDFFYSRFVNGFVEHSQTILSVDDLLTSFV